MGLLAAIGDLELIGLIVLVIGSLVTLMAGRLWWPWHGQRRGSKGDDD
jgi:hypothetical protein